MHGETRNTYTILTGKPRDETIFKPRHMAKQNILCKRPTGRPRHRPQDYTEMK
jgi:hypothetical protein